METFKGSDFCLWCASEDLRLTQDNDLFIVQTTLTQITPRLTADLFNVDIVK